MSLSRGELLKRGAAALAAGNIYSLVDALAAAPARATVTAARGPEQYLLPGQKVVLELGIEVIVPPLHHRVITAKVKSVSQKRLEKALAALERQYANSPAGLGVTVAWGLPYFKRLVPKLADGRRYPTYLPKSAKGAAVTDATRFASDPSTVVLGGDDVAVLLRSDDASHLDHAQHALFTDLHDLFSVTTVRSGFVGNAKEMALGAGIAGADLIVDGVQMFLGFTSTQKAAMAPDRIASFETLAGYTDQKPKSFWAGGTAMHLSHLDEDLERWWAQVPFTDQLRSMTRPGLVVPDKTYTIAEDVSRVETPADVHGDLSRFGGVGHSATLQTVTRLQRDTRDAYGVIRPRGTAIVSRADFNTLDNPFTVPVASSTPSAGVHFIAFAPSSDIFNRARRAMDGSLGDGSSLQIDPRATAQGFNNFIHATHRQNFVVPPRSRRSFPLWDLTTKRA
ncbi:MAG TPA: hypothetical protein VGQ38_20970 [Gaiellaceae bacterium]|jgi:hypothetical protein|nr:hypothetical protein [Gaiellaceae bacterium]